VVGACPTIACENGISRSCNTTGGQWSYKKVVCGVRKDLVGFDDLYGLDTQTKRLLDLTRQQTRNIEFVKQDFPSFLLYANKYTNKTDALNNCTLMKENMYLFSQNICYSFGWDFAWASIWLGMLGPVTLAMVVLVWGTMRCTLWLTIDEFTGFGLEDSDLTGKRLGLSSMGLGVLNDSTNGIEIGDLGLEDSDVDPKEDAIAVGKAWTIGKDGIMADKNVKEEILQNN
jgi:hypothetical protein